MATLEAQKVLEGKPRQKRVFEMFILEKVSRVLQALNLDTGEITFMPAKNAPIDTSQLPHSQQSNANQFDLAETETSLAQAKKKSTTTSGVDVDEKIRKVGGDPTFKIPKPNSSFRFKRK